MKERPVKCGICGKTMYYQGQENWEEEILVMVDDRGIHPKKYWHPQYVHLRCWNALRPKKETVI